MSEQTNFYIKQLDYAGAPNWAVYERTEAGAQVICLCYDEPTARRIMHLLEEDSRAVIDF